MNLHAVFVGEWLCALRCLELFEVKTAPAPKLSSSETWENGNAGKTRLWDWVCDDDNDIHRSSSSTTAKPLIPFTTSACVSASSLTHTRYHISSDFRGPSTTVNQLNLSTVSSEFFIYSEYIYIHTVYICEVKTPLKILT